MVGPECEVIPTKRPEINITYFSHCFLVSDFDLWSPKSKGYSLISPSGWMQARYEMSKCPPGTPNRYQSMSQSHYLHCAAMDGVT